jgi:hypothetical protein
VISPIGWLTWGTKVCHQDNHLNLRRSSLRRNRLLPYPHRLLRVILRQAQDKFSRIGWPTWARKACHRRSRLNLRPSRLLRQSHRKTCLPPGICLSG